MRKVWDVISFFAWGVLILSTTACTLNADISSLESVSNKNIISAKSVFFDATVLNLTEGSAAVVNVVLSEKFEVDTVVKVSVTGDSGAIQPISSTLTIPAGTLSKPITIQTIEDFIFMGSRSLQLVLSSDDQNLVAQPSTLNLNITDNDLPTVIFSSSAQTVNENVGTFTLTAQLNAVSPNTVTIPLLITGTATQGTNDDYTLSSSTLVIPAGQNMATLTFNVNDDTLYESSETIIVNMGTLINGNAGSPATFTATITDNDLGAFSISGITGASDSTADAFLVGGTNATVNWSSASGATSYDVTIYASNGTTVACSTMNTTSTSYDFSSCSLTAGNTYKATVIANGLGLTVPATNNQFSFYVNRSPIANDDGPVRRLKGSAVVTLNVVSGSDSVNHGTVADTDPDSGDTITITAVSASTAGATITYTTNAVLYTPPANFTGVDSFTYTISDSRGATDSASVTIHVMDTYTWTGKVSANWNNAGNWCGTITNNICDGATGFPNNWAAATHVARFDGTCTATGHSCNANTNGAAQAYGITLLGYTGTLTQTAGAGNVLSIGNGGYSQSSGTFVGSDANITMNGDFNLSGGSFTSTQATLSVYFNFTVTNSPTFTANSGTTRIVANSTITPLNITLHHVTFDAHNINTAISGTLKMSGDLVLNSSTGYPPQSLNGGTIEVQQGNVSVTGYGCAGSTIISLRGTNQIINSTTAINGNMPGLNVTTTTGTTVITGTVTLRNGYVVTSGAVDASASTIALDGGAFTPSTTNFNNLSFYGYNNTITVTGTATVNGTLTLAGQSSSPQPVLSGGTIEAYGNVTVAQFGYQGSTLVRIKGSGKNLVGGASSLSLTPVEIDTAGTITMTDHIHFQNGLKHISGTVNASGSTAYFSSNTIIPNTMTFGNVVFNGYVTTATITGTLRVGGKLLIEGSSWSPPPTINGGAIQVYGDFEVSTAGAQGNTPISMVGPNAAKIIYNSGNIPGSVFTIAKDVGVAVTLDKNFSFSYISVSSGNFDMAGKNLTLSSLSLNGNTLTKNSGVLTVNGTVAGTGSYYGGFLNP